MEAFIQLLSERFLLELILKGSLIMLAAFGIAFVLQRASAALRHAVWSLAFVGLLLLPLCTVLLPAWRITVPGLRPADVPVSSEATVSSGTATSVSQIFSEAAGSSASAANADTPAAASIPNSAASASGWSWTRLAIWIWIAGTLVLLLRTAVVLHRLSIVRRSGRPVTDPVWKDHAEMLPELLNIRRKIRLFQHEDIAVPMTYGVRRPVILLPEHAEGWSDEQKHATMMHELLHVRRFDHLIHLLALTARALHWFNPLAWAAAKRLVVERERACDDGVLAMGVASTSYADHLLGMARFVLSGREASAVALAMARPSELRSRIIAILDPGQPRRSVTRTRGFAMAGCALTLVMLVAAAQPAAEPAENDAYPLGHVHAEDGAIGEDPRPLSHVQQGEEIADAVSAAERDDSAAAESAMGTGERTQAADTIEVEAQKRAIHAIAELPKDRSIPLLREIAQTHRNEELRAEAVFWLGEADDASTADLLVSFARNDPSLELQKKAVFALAELEDGRGGVHLLELARSHPHVAIREEAVFWLGEAGGPDVAEQLAVFARSDESDAVQKKAIFALADLDQNEGVEHLIDLARSHPNPALRSEAIFWLGETGDPRAADVLMDIVNGR